MIVRAHQPEGPRPPSRPPCIPSQSSPAATPGQISCWYARAGRDPVHRISVVFHRPEVTLLRLAKCRTYSSLRLSVAQCGWESALGAMHNRGRTGGLDEKWGRWRPRTNPLELKAELDAPCAHGQGLSTLVSRETSMTTAHRWAGSTRPSRCPGARHKQIIADKVANPQAGLKKLLGVQHWLALPVLPRRISNVLARSRR